MAHNPEQPIQLKELEQHLEKWREAECHEGRQDFIEDGMLDPSGWYRKEAVKALFILKEPNYSIERELKNTQGLYTDEALANMAKTRWVRLRYLIQAYQRLGADKPLGGSFKHLQTIACGLQEANRDAYPSYESANKNRNAAAAHLAFMNLKKVPGGPTEGPEYRALAKRLQEAPDGTEARRIKKQLEILFTFDQIRPRCVIVCCGNGGCRPFDALRSILDIKSSTNSGGVVTHWNGLPETPVFSTHHPNRAGELHYRDLMCQYQQYLRSISAR